MTASNDKIQESGKTMTIIARLRKFFARPQQSAEDRAAQRDALVRAGMLGLY